MHLIGILAGWTGLSCIAAPLIGRFIAAHATPAAHIADTKAQHAPLSDVYDDVLGGISA